MSDRLPLRVITYLVPSISVEVFETFTQYLESALQREAMLIYESRFGGPLSSRADPFKENIADLGMSHNFMEYV